MPNLIIAITLGIVGIIVLYKLLPIVGVPEENVVKVLTAIPGLAALIRGNLPIREKSAKADTGQDLIVSLEGYSLPMTRLILCGWLYILAALELASVVGGVTANVAELNKKIELYVKADLLVTFLTAWPAIFLTGRWIGRRYISHGVITVIIVASISIFSASLIDIILVPKTVFKALFGTDKSIEIIELYLLYGIPGTIVISILGFWRGRHQRLTTYLGYLMEKVSPNARKAIVEIAYEEAKKSPDTRVDSKASISNIAR